MPVVWERGTGVAVGYCGRLLGGTGATVVKTEPPAGDRLRREAPTITAADGRETSALFEYLGCFKSSVNATEDNVARLARAADIVLDDHDGDPAGARARHEAVRAVNPDAVYVVLSSFGMTGPYAGYRGNPFIDLAAGAYLSTTGDPDREPLQAGGPWAGYSTGIVGAIAALAALRLGRGQLVDVSAMETMASLHQWALTLYTHQGYVRKRAGNRTPESFHPMSFYPSRTDWVCLGVALPPQWEAFCVALEMPELLFDPRFETGGDRFDHADELDELIVPRLLELTAEEIIERLQGLRVPAGPVHTVLDVLGDRQLQSRSFWAPLPHLGAAAVVPERPFHVEGEPEFTSAPARPESSLNALPSRSSSSTSLRRGTLPLEGVRVIELTIAWSGPLAGRWLGDLGAEVIKVEAPLSRGAGVMGVGGERLAAELAEWEWGHLPGPAFRSGIFPNADPGERPWNRQGLFNKMNRNKRSLCIDLKRPEAEDVLADLVRSSDVVLNNFSPKGVASLGIDHDTLAGWNPNIVSVSLSGYGHTGPDATRFAWGQILEAHSGLAAATGYEDGGPHRMGQPFPDPIAGLHCAFAVLAGLRQRDARGHGVFIDASQLETYASIGGELYLMASLTGAAPEPPGNRSPSAVLQGVYRCEGDDEWIAISIENDDEWQALVAVLGDAADDINRWTSRRSKFAAMHELQSHGIRACAAMTTRDVVENEHIAARGFIVEWDQVDAGRQRFPGNPAHLEHPSSLPMRGAPGLGADNEYVLGELLGYSDEQIRKLTETEVLATQPPPI